MGSHTGQCLPEAQISPSTPRVVLSELTPALVQLTIRWERAFHLACASIEQHHPIEREGGHRTTTHAILKFLAATLTR